MAGELLNHLTPDVMSAMFQSARFHAEILGVGMDDVQNNPKKYLGAGLKMGSVVALAIGLVGGGIKSYDSVAENHEGMRSKGDRLRAKTAADGREWLTRKKPGELYGHVGPGPHAHLPWLGGIKKVSTEDYTSELDAFHVVAKDEGKDTIKAKVTWGVMPRNSPNVPKGADYAELLYRAVVGASSRKEMAEGVEAMCGESLRHFMREQENPRAVKGEDAFAALTEQRGADLMLKYCVELRGVYIGDVAPTEATTLARVRQAAQGPASALDLVNWGDAAVVTPELRLIDNA